MRTVKSNLQRLKSWALIFSCVVFVGLPCCVEYGGDSVWCWRCVLLALRQRVECACVHHHAHVLCAQHGNRGDCAAAAVVRRSRVAQRGTCRAAISARPVVVPRGVTPARVAAAAVQVRGPKKHLKRLNAPKHWMLDKMGGIWAPKPSCGPHKVRRAGRVVWRGAPWLEGRLGGGT